MDYRLIYVFVLLISVASATAINTDIYCYSDYYGGLFCFNNNTIFPSTCVNCGTEGEYRIESSDPILINGSFKVRDNLEATNATVENLNVTDKIDTSGGFGDTGSTLYDNGNASFDGNISMGDKIIFKLGAIIDNIISGVVTISENLIVLKNFTASNYQGISIRASASGINISVNGSTTLVNKTCFVMDGGTICLTPAHMSYISMQAEEGSAMSSTFASGAVLGEQWSVANGQVGVANKVATCDGEFMNIAIQCRTPGTGVGVVALTIHNHNPESSTVLPCNVTTSGTTAPSLTICDSGSAKFEFGDDLRLRTMVSDTSAICSVFAEARCY